MLTYRTRGEISVRVLQTARELGLYTIALFTAGDDTHTSYANEAIEIPSVVSYVDIDLLVALCREHRVDLVHPGYGFLSESAAFCEELSAAEVNVKFIGPGPETLRQTGDKLRARKLAEECGVPVLPALARPVDDVATLRRFSQSVGMPVMLKAVDGGGGRGIRLVHDEENLESELRNAANESSSGQVFAEKAAVAGFRHVEVQILGDGLGNVRHCWERECSIQRHFQKTVEIAPSRISDRRLVSALIGAALRMAKAIKYLSLGTWEFLVQPESSTFYFMEINPRLQVEHTITEAICGVDLVRWQILTALNDNVDELGLACIGSSDPEASPPTSTALQLRITAEDPRHNFSASIGRLGQVLFPGGNGLRVDTNVRPGTTVTTDFDSLLAKLIVTGRDWTTVVAKAERALEDVVVDGVATNIDLLQHIVRSQDFRTCAFDTQWLENKLEHILARGQGVQRHANPTAFRNGTQQSAKTSQASNRIMRKGDRFDVQIEGDGLPSGSISSAMSVTSIVRNDFPNSLALELSLTNTHGSSTGQSYTLKVKQPEAHHGPGAGRGRSAPADPASLVCPIAGQLVEILVEDGDHVGERDAIAILRQMKMELEVRAHRSGIVSSLFEHEEGDDIAVGTVICSITPVDKEKL